MLVFQNNVKRCWMRRPLVDVILSRSAVLMFLAWPKPCNDVGSLRSHCFALMASETTTHRHVRKILAGLPRNDLTVLNNGGHIYCEWPAKCIGWSLVELTWIQSSTENCGRELLMTACDSCSFAKKNNLLERHRWQFLTSDPRFKEYMGRQCQGNHEHVWKQKSEGKREYPSATIRRLVNGFVHDLTPPQLTCFCLKLIVFYPPLQQFLLLHLLKKPRRIFSSGTWSCSKLIHRLHVSGGHVSKTSLRLLLQRRGCPVWMQQMVDQLQCDSCLESSDAHNAQQVSLATPPKIGTSGEDRNIRIRRLPKEKILCTLYGRNLQTVVMLMLSGKKSSSAFRAERYDSHFTSGQGLNAAFSAVSVSDFGPWWTLGPPGLHKMSREPNTFCVLQFLETKRPNHRHKPIKKPEKLQQKLKKLAPTRTSTTADRSHPNRTHTDQPHPRTATTRTAPTRTASTWTASTWSTPTGALPPRPPDFFWDSGRLPYGPLPPSLAPPRTAPTPDLLLLSPLPLSPLPPTPPSLSLPLLSLRPPPCHSTHRPDPTSPSPDPNRNPPHRSRPSLPSSLKISFLRF